MKFKVILKGKKVHDVGYRVFLTNKALSLGVKNFNTFNMFIDGTQSVIALIEADAEIFDFFKGLINTTSPNNAEVENISIEEYTNSIPPIETCMQAFQMEQWGKGIPILVKMLEKQDQMLGKQDQMIDKQDQMLDKQDQMLGKQDQMLGKQDQMIVLQKETIVTIKTEGEKTRDVISGHISQDIEDLKQEISDIKDTMAKIANKVGVEV
jgi:acylphosphatase